MVGVLSKFPTTIYTKRRYLKGIAVISAIVALAIVLGHCPIV